MKCFLGPNCVLWVEQSGFLQGVQVQSTCADTVDWRVLSLEPQTIICPFRERSTAVAKR